MVQAVRPSKWQASLVEGRHKPKEFGPELLAALDITEEGLAEYIKAILHYRDSCAVTRTKLPEVSLQPQSP